MNEEILNYAEPILLEFARSSQSDESLGSSSQPKKMLLNKKNIDQLIDEHFTELNEIIKRHPEATDAPEEKRKQLIKATLLIPDHFLYDDLQNVILKKEFPKSFDQVKKNFQLSNCGILSDCITPSEEELNQNTGEAAITIVSFSTPSYVDNTYEKDGEAYRQTKIKNSFYIGYVRSSVDPFAPNASEIDKKEDIFIPGELIITFNLSDGTHKIEGNPVLVDLVSKQHSKEDRESSEYWKKYASKAELIAFIKGKDEFVKKTDKRIWNQKKIIVEVYGEQKYEEELKKLVSIAAQNGIKPVDIIKELESPSVNQRKEIYSLFSDASPVRNLKNDDFGCWMRKKMTKIEKIAQAKQSEPAKMFESVVVSLSDEREKMALSICNDSSNQPDLVMNAKEKLTQIESALVAVEKLKLREEAKEEKPTKLFLSIDDATFIVDRLEKDYASCKEDRKSMLKLKKSEYLRVLERVASSYSKKSSPEDKKKIEALFAKAENSPIITTHPNFSLIRNFFGQSTKAKQFALKLKETVLDIKEKKEEEKKIIPPARVM